MTPFARMNFSLPLILASLALLPACVGASSPDGSAPPKATTIASASAAPEPAPASETSVAAPAPETSVAAPEPKPEPAPEPATPPEEAPLPAVKVKNIGMHIGGGPHDDATKDPIRRSVEPHFDELRRCFAKVDDPKKGGDFGVDLLIDGKGGKAKVSHPRTALKGEGFTACVVSVFEAIDFLRPKGGIKTMVSYSLRFTP